MKRGSMRPTDTEIARRAGIAPSTLSMYQRGLRGLAPKTEKRVVAVLRGIEKEEREAAQAAAEERLLAQFGVAVLAGLVGILSNVAPPEIRAGK